MHFAEGDVRHAAAYMAGRPGNVQRGRVAAGPVTDGP
jgi:hypothetical protein